MTDEIGYNKISQIVDWIRLRVDISFPFYEDKDQLDSLLFNVQKKYSRFELTTQVYCKENDTKSVCIYDMNVLIGHPLVFRYNPEEYFAGLYKKFNKILSKPSNKLTKQEKRIVLSLRWLSLAIQNNNPLDKLLYLWIALEFIVAGAKAEKRFGRRDRMSIMKKINELDLNDTQLEIIESKLKQLDDLPLKEKLLIELEKKNIILNDSELEVLEKLRRTRNDIIHGRKINEINDEDIEKFTSIIERLIVFSV